MGNCRGILKSNNIFYNYKKYIKSCTDSKELTLT